MKSLTTSLRTSLYFPDTASRTGVVRKGIGDDTKNFQQTIGLPVNYRGATTSPLAMLATVPGVSLGWNADLAPRRNAAHLPVTQIGDTADANFAFALV
jgi:hypothetical protein